MDLRVWVGCLACYNAGRLVGDWMDASDAADWKCPRDPSHEEFQCMDDEVPWVSHEMSATEATAWAEAVADVEDYEAEAFTAFMAHEGWRSPSDVNLDDFRERYCGEWESPEAHAWEYLEDVGISADAPGYFMLRFDEIAWRQDYVYENGHVFRSY